VNRNTSDASADEYEALRDPRQVMAEVVRLVENLGKVTRKLGDAIIAGGLQAREWRLPDARLTLLSDQFPDITVDELITRLSEFSGLGPYYLQGREEDIAHFNGEVEILYEVVRSLHVQIQRLRMLPRRDRSNWPLERALRDARTSTAMDLVQGVLRDLESLAPYLVPLTAEERQAEPPPAPDSSQRESPRSPLPVDDIEAPENVPQPPQSPTRLRDYVELRTATTGDAELRIQVPRLPLSRGILVMLAIITLASGTLLLSMATHFHAGNSTARNSPAVLSSSPSHATLTCTGTGSTLNLILRNSGSAALAWSIQTPAGLDLSPTHGVLAPSQAVSLLIKATGASATRGTLEFTSNYGPLSVPYSVTCG
jgi:hypothetical protein